MRLLLSPMTLTLLLSVMTGIGVYAQEPNRQDSSRQNLSREDNRLAARAASDEAERLRGEKTAESLRQAIVKFEVALPLWRAADDRSGEAETLTNAAQVFNSLGEKQKALDYFQQSLTLWKALGESKGQADALSGIGEVYFTLGEHRRALDYMEQSLQLRRAIEDRRGEAMALNDIGVIYHTLGELQKALDYYNQALPLQRGAGNPSGEAMTLNAMGVIFRIRGATQQALAYFKQALALQRAAGDLREAAITLTNIGALYFRLGDAQQALDYYDQALPLRRKSGDRAGQAITLTNIGGAYLSLGDPQRALEYLKQSLSLVQGGQSRSEEAQALNVLAAASSALGDRQTAIEYLQQALKLWRAIGERQGESSALIRMGRIYRELGDRQKALGYLEQALELTRIIGERSNEAAALADIARVEQDLGNLDQARTRIEAALDLVETMRGRITAEDLRVSFLASKYSDYEFYIDLLMRLHERRPAEGFEARALEANERARGRNLLEALATMRSDIHQGIDPSLLEQQRLLQQQLNAKEQLRMRLAGRGETEKAAAAEKELRSLLIEYQELKDQIVARNPQYAALTDPAPLKLTEIQQRVLDPETLLLEYALGEERSFLWAVTPAAIRVYTLPGRAAIEAAALRAYGRLIKSNHREYTVSAEQAMTELSRMVLGPVAQDLGQKRLVIVSDGALQYMPFGAFPDPAGSSMNRRRPLIAGHEIISLPSISVLATIRREPTERQQTARTVAVFSDPVFQLNDPRVKHAKFNGEKTNPEEPKTESTLVRSAKETGVMDFERLIHTRQEAEAIIALVPPEQGFKALDFAASRATVMNAGLDQYRIIHFATHGLLNSRRPEFSGIVLSLVDEQGTAQEGFLRAHEIYNMKLNAELVVLSACSTALGKEIKGEGLVGLTRGFMYAGTPRIIASLWNVRDEATAELMKRFYRTLLAGKSSPAVALREAQVSMWREPRWAAPYYWAGFILQGEWR